MFTRAFCALAGLVLATAATLQSAEASTSPPQTMACVRAALTENGLTLRSARRLQIGKELRIHDFRVTLVRGDTVWGLCSVLGRVATAPKAVETAPAAVLPAPSPAPVQIVVPAKADEKTAAELASAKQELSELKETKKAADTRAANLEHDLKSWKAAAIGLGVALLLALIALAFAIALFLREKRARTALAAKAAQAPPSSGESEELDPIPFTFTRDAVTLAGEPANLTFFIRPSHLTRTQMGDPWEMHCVLPWGAQTKYAPERILELLHSKEARDYFAQHGIVLKDDTRESILLREPLPRSIVIPLAMSGEARQEAA